MPCYSFDPVLVNYILDPTTDMHRDQAMNIFELPASEIIKPIRHIGKNKFVFPQFYGDWYKSCAAAIWEEAQGLKTASGIDLMHHLKLQGYPTLEKFENHIKDVENKFWTLLDATSRWKDKAVKDYLQKGYVELYTGFRRHGLLDRKQIVNTPIQGTAFHCLLWSYMRVSEIAESEGWESNLIGQIHDEMIADVVPEEEEHVAATIKRVMCEDIKEWAKW